MTRAGAYWLNLDSCPLGAGRRLVVAYAIGPKAVQVLAPGTLEHIAITTADFRQYAKPAPEVRIDRLARRMERRRLQFRRANRAARAEHDAWAGHYRAEGREPAYANPCPHPRGIVKRVIAELMGAHDQADLFGAAA